MQFSSVLLADREHMNQYLYFGRLACRGIWSIVKNGGLFTSVISHMLAFVVFIDRFFAC